MPMLPLIGYPLGPGGYGGFLRIGISKIMETDRETKIKKQHRRNLKRLERIHGFVFGTM
ncbi:hypothetical protein NC653_011688 [Populus alba x Populus x berolinensis]|uniref:Uncharacterized protein n=1 Tax=Populus alba x Populus x berolinensis TaxID=444605 RepID=A0AAD6R2W5_9ROSI|nr:hypothetical protein NC653_011688 [Populus alba x Populus x berolinensis]